MVVVRRLLGEMCRYLITVGSCKEFVRRIQRYSIELRAVRNLLEEFEVFDRVGSCKEIVRRNVMYQIPCISPRRSWRGTRYLVCCKRLLGEMSRYQLN